MPGDCADFIARVALDSHTLDTADRALNGKATDRRNRGMKHFPPRRNDSPRAGTGDWVSDAPALETLASIATAQILPAVVRSFPAIAAGRYYVRNETIRLAREPPGPLMRHNPR